MMAGDANRIVVLAPDVVGAGGISMVVRHVLGIWNAQISGTCPRPEVWSLNDDDAPLNDRPLHASIRTAAHGKFRFATWGVREGFRSQSKTMVIVMHLALAPVAFPLVFRGARMVLFLHGIECWRPLRRLEAAAVRRAWLVMANSEYTIRRFKEANPTLADRNVRACPLGTEIPLWDAEAEKGNEGFALIVGRMSAEERYKGHDLLLEMWPDVTRYVPSGKLVIAGDGDDRMRLQKKAAAMNLSGKVEFLGRVSDNTLKQLYRQCAFFIMPSRHEGFGLVFLEAMTAARACIGGIGAASEVIEDGVTGFVVDPDNRDQVRDTIVRLFQDPKLASRMGAAGAQRVAGQFTESHFQERFRALLNSDHNLSRD